MRLRLRTTMALLLALPAMLFAQTRVVDYHQHLFSPDAAALVMGDRNAPGISARDLIMAA